MVQHEKVAFRMVAISGALLLASCSVPSSGLATGPVARRAVAVPVGGSVGLFTPRPARLAVPETSLRPAGPSVSSERAVLAVDIDETLTKTDYQYLLWGIGTDDTLPLPGSQATLSRLAATFDIVYVTARSRSLKGKTERWLARHEFPQGRLVTSFTLGGFIFQGEYKRDVIRQLRREYPNMLAGIGDKPKDGMAYRRSSMVSLIVNPWPQQEYHEDDIVLRDWAAVSRFFEANHDVLSNPRLARKVLNGGGPGLNLSGRARKFPGQS